MPSTPLIFLFGIFIVWAIGIVWIEWDYRAQMRCLKQAGALRLAMVDRIADAARASAYPRETMADYFAMLNEVELKAHVNAVRQKRDPLVLYAPPLRQLMTARSDMQIAGDR